MSLYFGAVLIWLVLLFVAEEAWKGGGRGQAGAGARAGGVYQSCDTHETQSSYILRVRTHPPVIVPNFWFCLLCYLVPGTVRGNWQGAFFFFFSICFSRFMRSDFTGRDVCWPEIEVQNKTQRNWARNYFLLWLSIQVGKSRMCSFFSGFFRRNYIEAVFGWSGL